MQGSISDDPVVAQETKLKDHSFPQANAVKLDFADSIRFIQFIQFQTYINFLPFGTRTLMHAGDGGRKPRWNIFAAVGATVINIIHGDEYYKTLTLALTLSCRLVCRYCRCAVVEMRSFFFLNGVFFFLF
jgi:hypothetical protein